ncbi:alpha-L-fucosidase [Candidatus Poribacteria bacterium]|nr:alpha-L-fucosidase [Candidatus Poribacteria bacterium]
MDPKPTRSQLEWQQSELTMFLHFGVNTFTNREWGEGTEDPAAFNPSDLDARQWVQTAKDAGFRYMILTAKHHDGFCLWRSDWTNHSVKSSPWRGGKGDVVGELAQACADAGMKLGIYLSPWDRNAPTYGDSPAYNEYFCRQLTELMTRYGPIGEAWFDGACGEGPNGKRQEYDWQSYYAVIREHQPDAVIAICGPDVRWVGNEDGYARETEWSVQDANPAIHGVGGKVWYPAECDVSIRPGWFWHAHEDARVKTLPHLMDIYYRSVGRNSVLLLNVPPNDRGLFADPDVARLGEFRDAIDRSFRRDVALGARAGARSATAGSPAACAVDNHPETYWQPTPGTEEPWIELRLAEPVSVNTAMTQERIAEGQHVEEYRIDAWVAGAWQRIVSGTTMGHKKLDRFPAVRTNRVRLTIVASRDTPLVSRFSLFDAPAFED